MTVHELYEATTNELRDRILALIPEHPEILDIESLFDLYDIDGFECDDLQPSMGQARRALESAKKAFRQTNS